MNTGRSYLVWLSVAVGSVATSLACAQAPCSVTHRIHQVQGSGAATPLAGTTVTVEGIVTADFQSIPQSTVGGQLRGFFMQEEDADVDGDPATSEGIFVFTGNNPPADVLEGQRVCVRGSASEFFNMTQLTATTTGSIVITAPIPAPAPAPAEIDLPVVGDVDAFYEQREGMLVRFVDPMVVSEYFELARYGQLVLTANDRPYQYSHLDDTPTAAEYAVFLDNLRRRRIILDDDNNTQNAPLPSGVFFHPVPGGFGVGTQGVNYFRGGDTIFPLIGVLHWSFAGQTGTDAWRVRPTRNVSGLKIGLTNSRPAASPPVDSSLLKVVSFNVLNYFTTIDTTSSDSTGPCGPSGTLDCRGADSIEEFERQTTKLLAALNEMRPDVAGLVEIENGPTAGTPAIATLAERLSGASGELYRHIDTGIVGTDAITVGFIYRAGRVRPIGPPALLTAAGFTDPLGTGQQRNRPAVAQTFEQISNGERLNVIVNHLKSKSPSGATGADLDQLDGQSAWNATRTAAARYLADIWLPTDPTGQQEPDNLIIGDLNAYRGEGPITALAASGYTDLLRAYEGDDAYSYVFDGQLGYLDHALANDSMASQVVSVQPWLINADEVPVFDYNDTTRTTGEATFEAKPTGNPLYEPNEFRTSDHDPVVVALELRRPAVPGDADDDGDIDRDDVALITAARNQPAAGPNDPRDVNRDGVINVVDARLAATRCTRPRCATSDPVPQ
jgi:uncharacterized protein